jgi:putative nucleotidyltransferase with HDIG domain
MAALVGRIIGAKPFPVTARRLADLTRQDVVRIEPVIQVLESDPGLSVRLLRLVNSAGYALRQRCTSVRHAATLVGTDRLHQIATTAAVLDLFDSKGPVAAQIIEHSTVVGAFCRYLGAHLALPVDDLFTAGFLHDIGKLMLMETENEQYVELLAKCASRPDSIHHLERALYGFDHAVLAAHVLTAWNIPDPVPKIVAWHHEPSHAYKVSSMMAALVQTVRLSDALVYVMQADPGRENIKEVAQHEAASYLDISEPQLAAMWDELRVLFDESREQCLGENAPALDPRSLRPKRPMSLAVESTPSERTHELPKQFPCVECGCPTFGNTCPACGGYVCPDHQVGRDAWCSLCARDYRSEKSSMPVPMPAKWAFAAVSAAVFVSGIAGMISSGGRGALRAGLGTLLLGSLITLLYVVGKQWFIRSRFVRTRPNRFVAEAFTNDGGTQSLVPPDYPEGHQPEFPQSAGTLIKADVRLVEPLKEIAIREITDHDASNSELNAPPTDTMTRGGERLLDAVLSRNSSSIDSNRVRLQSNSLVTLPVPAMPAPRPESPNQGLVATSAEHPRRMPRDTLLERDRDSRRSAGENHDDDSANGPRLLADPVNELDDTDPPPTESNTRGRSDDDTQVDRDTLYGPEFERTAQADVTLNSAREDLILSEIVRPMPTIEVSAVDNDAPTNSPAVDCLPRSDEHRNESPSNLGENDEHSRQISVHPLAALGFKSEAPLRAQSAAPPPVDQITPDKVVDINAPNVTPSEEVATSPETSQAAPIESPKAPELPESPALPQSEPMQAREPSAVTESRDASAADAPSENANGFVRAPQSTNGSANLDLIQSLIEKSGVRFGDEFEARVRELVAQRVAEIVAERMLAAFGSGAITAPQPPLGVQSQAGRTSANTQNSRQDGDSLQPVPLNSPTRKSRSPNKQRKSARVDAQDPKPK